MSGFTFAATCARCGGPLRHISGGVYAGTEAAAVAECATCRSQWSLRVFLRPVALDSGAADRKRKERGQ